MSSNQIQPRLHEDQTNVALTYMLDVRELCVSYDYRSVINDLYLAVEQYQLVCLLGPSGCGKSTLLRTIAGFHTPTSGTISVGNSVLSHAGFNQVPEKRRIGMVFQDIALFPHMTVAQNIRFGLQNWSGKEAKDRVIRLLDLIGLSSYGERFPHELSGGQQRRVAMARAIAPKPRLLLMDEPFTGLDASLRETLAPEIATVLRQEKITTIMVTHDQREAFAFADKIAIMNQGRIEQINTPYNIYHNPITRFAADFVGEGDFLRGKLQGNHLIFALGCIELSSDQLDQFAELPNNIDVFIRPDDILHDDESDIKGRIIARRFRGTHFLYQVELESGEIVACFADSHHDHHVGHNLGLSPNLHHLLLFKPSAAKT